MIQGVLPAFSGLLSVKIRAVEPFFHDLDIVVAKIPPEQIIDLMPCGAGLIFGKQGGGFADGIVAACQDPAVNRQQVRHRRKIYVLKMGDREPGRVPQLGEEAFGQCKVFRRKKGIGTQLCVCRPIPYGIGGVGGDQLSGRKGAVAFGFADLFSFFGKDKTADHNILPGEFSGVVKASDNGVKSPGADNLVGLTSHAHGNERDAAAFIDLGRYGGGSPGVENRAFGNKFVAAAGALTCLIAAGTFACPVSTGIALTAAAIRRL